MKTKLPDFVTELPNLCVHTHVICILKVSVIKDRGKIKGWREAVDFKD